MATVTSSPFNKSTHSIKRLVFFYLFTSVIAINLTFLLFRDFYSSEIRFFWLLLSFHKFIKLSSRDRNWMLSQFVSLKTKQMNSMVKSKALRFSWQLLVSLRLLDWKKWTSLLSPHSAHDCFLLLVICALIAWLICRVKWDIEWKLIVNLVTVFVQYESKIV